MLVDLGGTELGAVHVWHLAGVVCVHRSWESKFDAVVVHPYELAQRYVYVADRMLACCGVHVSVFKCVSTWSQMQSVARCTT